MILRTLYSRGGMFGLDLAKFLCLPFKVIEESLGFLKNEKAIEVLGGDLIGRVSYRFNLTDLGRKRATEALKMSAYVGPAPVPLEDYVEQVYRQAVTNIDVNPEMLKAALSHLVISDEMFSGIGPAIVSGKSVFIYGPPGNGKTAITQAVGNFMNQSGGEIYVPYAILAEDSGHHHFRQGRASNERRRRRQPVGRQRSDHPSAPEHGYGRSALGAHPPAGHHHRRRAESVDARPPL